MSYKKHFVFLYVEDKILANILNTAIVVLNPRERWPAHITLAGPYETKRSVPKDLRFDRRVSVFGVGQFRSEKQNTVHFRVSAHGLKDVWRKPDYPYNPHMTIYDGNDHELGDELYANLKSINPIFKFDVSSLHIVTSTAQRDFNLLSEIDFSFLKRSSQEKFRNIDSLMPDDRILVARECVKRAVEYCANFR